MGSVKSNVGHTLQASGLVGMTKVILAMESGMIPQNLYTDNIDTTIPGIGDEKIQVRFMGYMFLLNFNTMYLLLNNFRLLKPIHPTTMALWASTLLV